MLDSDENNMYDIFNDDYFSSLEDSIEENISLLDTIDRGRLDFIDAYTKLCEVDPDFQRQDDTYPFYLKQVEPEISDSLIESINNSEINTDLELDTMIINEEQKEKRLEENMIDLINSVQNYASIINPDSDSYVNALNNIVLAHTDHKKGKTIDLNSRKEEIISNLVSNKIQAHIFKDEFIEAYDLFNSSAIPSYARTSFELDEINLDRLQEYRDKIILESIEKFKSGNFNSDEIVSTFDKFSELAEYLEYDLELKETNFPFHEITQFKFGGQDLKVGDIGKVILTYDSEENYFSVYFSKLRHNLTTKTSDKTELRGLFKAHVFNDLAGYHRNIKRPEDSDILGGGAYKVISKKNLFVDYDSGDFGKMQKGILEKCVCAGNYKLITLDDTYFKTSNFFEIVFHYISRS
jgi:hypothetical protein